MPLRPLPDLPHQWQGSTWGDHLEPQGDTPTPHDAPLHLQHQDERRQRQDERRQRQTRPPDLGARDTRYFLRAIVVLEPLRKAFGRLSGWGPSGTCAAMLGHCGLLLPTMPLLSAARVVTGLAIVPVGGSGCITSIIRG